MKTKNKLLITLTVFLILFVLIGSASAADDNTTLLSQDTDKEINQEEISTGNPDSSLILKSNDENTTLKTPVENRTFADIQDAIGKAEKGDTIELIGQYTGNGEDITIDEDELTIVGREDAKLDAQTQSRILTIDAKGIILKDITFKNGFEDKGGAVHIKEESDVTFINCSFDINNAKQGGAVYIDGKGTFINCSFGSNNATFGGSVMYNNKAEASFTNCSFDSNNATHGGAVALHNYAKASFTNCSFNNNSADEGGVIYDDFGYFTLTNCLFNNNRANNGGAAYLDGSDDDVMANFIDCSFDSNNATHGGAVYTKASTNFTNCSFTNNKESLLGGAVYIDKSGENSFNKCIFSNNIATTGGAIYNKNDKTIIDNSKFNYNNASEGQAIKTEKSMTISNSEFLGNGEYCIDVKYEVNITLNNISSDAPVINIISMEIVEAKDVIYGNDVNIKVQVNSSAMPQLNKGKVVVNVSGVEYSADIKDGLGTIVIPKLDTGDYDSDVAYIYNNHSKAEIPVSFTVKKAPTEIIIANDTLNLTVLELISAGASLNPAVAGNLSYSSSDSDVAIVEGGIIKALSEGSTKITVSFDGDDNYKAAKDKTITVNVDLNDASVSVENSTLNMIFNDTFDIVATTFPAGLDVNYKSSDKSVVKVDDNGKITAVGTGSAVITVSVGGDGIYAKNSTKINITVKKVFNLIAIPAVLNRNAFINISGFESATGNVTVTIGKDIYTSLISGDSIVINIPEYNETVAAYVYYPGDENYYNTSTTVDIIPKKDLDLKIIANPIFIGDNATVFITGLENATGNVTVTAVNDVYNVPIINGTATATIYGLNSTTTATVFYYGDNNYNMVSSTVDITVILEGLTWYVNATAAPGGDGRSKETAFQTFEDALDAAGHFDIIMIAPGTYTGNKNINFYIHTQNLNIMKYGDGEAIFDAEESSTIWDFDVNVYITGLTFTNAKSQSVGDSQGGALNFMGTTNTVHVKDCKFINNVASYGGAIFIYSGTVTNCTFIGNHADSNGGAILMEYGTITTCTFNGNHAGNNGGAISNIGSTKHVTADTCIFKTGSDSIFSVTRHSPTLNGDIFSTAYNSGEKLTFVLKTNGGKLVDDGIISMKIYNKTDDAEIANYTCISGEGWTADLPVGCYYAILNTQYWGFKPVNRTVNILPNIEYYVNVTPATSKNLTVDIFAKSNIPQDITEGKLQFILPNGTAIDAICIDDGKWWKEYTFDDYGDYVIGASYTGLNNVTINNATIIISTKDPSDVNVSDVVLNYGESKNVTVNTTGATGITAKINDVDAKVDGFTIEIPVMGAGNYTLTVTTIPDDNHRSVTKTATITVNKVPTEIVIANDTLSVNVLDLISAGASLTPAGAGNLTYTSSNSSVAVVENGKIRGLKAGDAVITVSFAGNEKYAAAENKTISVKVTLRDASVSVNNSTLNLKFNDTFDIGAVTSPEGLNVTYVPDDSGVVSVDENGVVTALKNGTAKITVKVGGDGVYTENSTVVTVNVKIRTEIVIANATLSVNVLDLISAGASLTPAGAGNLTFTSSNSSVAVVENGKIRGLKAGDAVITVSFAGNEKYAAAENKIISVKVTLRDASVSVENSTLNLKFNDTFDIGAVTSPEGLAVSYASSNEAVVTVDAKGRITTVGTGRAVVTVSVGGDGVYALNSTTIDVIVKKELDLNATAFDIFGNMTLFVNGLENATGNVSITVGENNYTSSIMGGMVFVSLPKFDENVTAYVYYPGDENYYAASTTADIIAKHDLNITVAADPIYVGEDAVVVVSGFENATGDVLIIAGKSFFNSTITNGIATASIPGLNNTTTVIVLYLGDDNYNMDFTSANITVSPKENLTISASANPVYVGDKVTVVVTGLENATGNVTVRVNNKTYSGVIVDGTAKVVISGLTKSVTAYVDYGGDRRYNPSNTTAKVTVNKIKTTLTAKSVTAVYNVYKNLVITLKDSKGNPISGVKVSVNLGKTRTVTTNKKGQAKVSTKGLVPKKYTAKITFKGNTKYLKSTKSVKVTVKKGTPKITAKTRTFKVNTKVKKYTVTLKNNINKAMTKSIAYLKVAGKIYKAKTSSQGKITFKITKLNKKGTFKATITYPGNIYYNKVTKKATIKVVA